MKLSGKKKVDMAIAVEDHIDYRPTFPGRRAAR